MTNTDTGFSTPSPTTSAPNSSGTAAGANDQSSNLSVAIGAGGGGGAVILVASALLLKRYSSNKRQQRGKLMMDKHEEWTSEEIQRFHLAYQNTHDFDELCNVVPNRTRESVAARTRSLMAKSDRHILSPFKATMLPMPSRRFKFVSERKKKSVLFSPMKSNNNMSVVRVDEVGSTINNPGFAWTNNNNNNRNNNVRTVSY